MIAVRGKHYGSRKTENGLSVPCSRVRHSQCFTISCTCACHPKVLDDKKVSHTRLDISERWV